MYNDRMPNAAFEIRVCDSCGLRYPLVEGNPFGARCPACMGETRGVLRRQLRAEPAPDPRRGDNRQVHLLAGKEESRQTWAVLLDNIRSAWNVGSILRSADGFGFTHAFLCGITPTADNEAVTKTALGAQDSVPWSYHKDAVRLVRGLKAEDWNVYALEEDHRATGLNRPAPKAFSEHEVLIVGNEITGVDPELLDLCDHILYIPMRGEKRSFNVAIAFGIAAYALVTEKSENNPQA
jgi:tRNA G18 (ribose-2'-O)-methylase SpoU